MSSLYPSKTLWWNQINQFCEKIFGQISFFAISKMTKNQFLNWEKFKTAKNAISRRNNWFIWFHEVFGLDFFRFSDPLCLAQWSIFLNNTLYSIDRNYFISFSKHQNHDRVPTTFFWIYNPTVFWKSRLVSFHGH